MEKAPVLLPSPNTRSWFRSRPIQNISMMPPHVWILLVTLGVLDSGLSFILNTCILVSGAGNLRSGQRLNPADLIHLIIAVVNIALQGLLTSQGLIFFFFTSLLFIKEFYFPAIVSTLTLMYFTYWVTAWLCIYYCVTICNFHHPFYVWSKRNISMYLPHLLLLSAGGCFLINLPIIWTTSVNVTLQTPVISTLDPIFISGTYIFQPSHLQAASFLGCCLPFILIFISITLTVSSLSRHVMKMRQKDSGLPQPKDQAHIQAIKTMCRFLTISFIFYVNAILFFSKNPDLEDPVVVVGWLIFISFPTAESLVIIYSSPKLRKHLKMNIFCFQRKACLGLPPLPLRLHPPCTRTRK